MTWPTLRSTQTLRREIRRAGRDRRRAAIALRHAEPYGDAVICIVLSERFHLAAMRCATLERLALAQTVDSGSR